jgi:uncharacterized Zn finger protein
VQGRARSVKTFWAKSWNTNLELYKDYANRLPRGTAYLSNGSVLDLKILPGMIQARVAGSSLYRVRIDITGIRERAWTKLKKACAGKIDSLVGLLQGTVPASVMEVMCEPEAGLFPRPNEIKLSCSCPDYADMCKHVAAVMYGVGLRLETQPDLLFSLRKVDHLELLSEATQNMATGTGPDAGADALDDDLGALFGIELDSRAVEKPAHKATLAAKPKPAAKSAKPAIKTAAKPAVKAPTKKKVTKKLTTPASELEALEKRLMQLTLLVAKATAKRASAKKRA